MHMRNYLHNYLLKLSGAGIDPVFGTVICRYGKFTMYCIIGPEENIVQITFAPQKHARIRQQLEFLHNKVHMRKILQKDFYLNQKFSDYFSGIKTRFSVPADSLLIAAGTEFQKRIWHHISTIPYGSCRTYQELAELAGSPKASRAAGTACGANPLALIIPCHRVVSVNGPGGFAGGVAVKKALLELEHNGSSNEDNCRRKNE